MTGRERRKEGLSMEKGHPVEEGPGMEESGSTEGSQSLEEKPSIGEGYSRGNPECKEFEKRIPEYIARRLDYPCLKRFYEHWEKCAECREELSIQFLVTEGMQRLEDGSAFDLQSELEQRLEETRRKVGFHSAFLYLGAAMEVMASCLLVWIFVWILL